MSVTATGTAGRGAVAAAASTFASTRTDRKHTSMLAQSGQQSVFVKTAPVAPAPEHEGQNVDVKL